MLLTVVVAAELCSHKTHYNSRTKIPTCLSGFEDHVTDVRGSIDRGSKEGFGGNFGQEMSAKNVGKFIWRKKCLAHNEKYRLFIPLDHARAMFKAI